MIDPLDYKKNVRRWASSHVAIGRARGLDRADLVQVGFLAVIKAARTHERNGRDDATFPGYVTPSIRRDISRAVNTPDALTASHSAPLDDLHPARPEPDDDDDDDAAAMLAALTDKQARAVELYLGLDGSPGRSVDEVARLMGYSSRGSCHRLIKSGLDHLKAAFAPGDP